MYLPSAAYAQINHIFSGPGFPRGAQVTYGVSAPVAFTNPSTLAGACHTIFAGNVMPQLSDDLTLVQTRAKIGPGVDGPFAFAGASVVGGISGDASTPQVSLLVKKNSALGGRMNSGRWFLPGLSETFLDVGGNVNAAYLSNVQTALNSFVAALRANADIEEMVLLHAEPGVAPTVILSLAAQSKIATQRRRLRKVGGRRRVTP